MPNGKGMVQRDRHSSTGSGALLVIVNGEGAFWDHQIVDETVLVALEHYGMPYRVFDLAKERLDAAILSNCAAIVLAQHHLGGSLTDAETTLIAEAVKSGVGLVNFDNDLLQSCPALLEIFGFNRINPHPMATNLIRIPGNSHYIHRMQFPGDFHTFNRMVTGTIVEEWREDVVPLIEGILGKDQLVYIRHLSPGSAFEPRNYPVMFAAHWGKGKAVQFSLNPRVWRNPFFGHARGIDDLFWRSILWAVRKPFAANMIPPFVSLSIDDCSGRLNFDYTDIAHSHHFVPLAGLFLKMVPARLFPKIRSGLQSGRTDFTTHALDYNTLLGFNFGRGECTREELEARFAFDDAWWKNVGAKPRATIRAHWGEWGVHALPFCKERGRIFFAPGRQTGLHKADMCQLDGSWPFNLPNCYYDYLPDDHDFFGFSAMFARHKEDFLSGSTPLLRESERTDVDKAARTAAAQICHGLRACFHAEIVTHEQKFDVLKLDEWDRILKDAVNQTKEYEKIYVSHDEIGHYLKGKDGVWIKDATVEGAQICCKLAGGTQSPLRLSVFRDEEDSVSREYRSLGPFTGEVETP